MRARKPLYMRHAAPARRGQSSPVGNQPFEAGILLIEPLILAGVQHWHGRVQLVRGAGPESQPLWVWQNKSGGEGEDEEHFREQQLEAECQLSLVVEPNNAGIAF